MRGQTLADVQAQRRSHARQRHQYGIENTVAWIIDSRQLRPLPCSDSKHPRHQGIETKWW